MATIEETKQTEFQNAKLTMDDFLANLSQEDMKLEKTIENNFPNRFFAIQLGLSIKAQMLIEGITQPTALFLLGPPSALKSTTLEILSALPDCYRSDSFTPRAFVSHSANVSEKKLKSIDLLPKIKHKTLITPELSILFTGNQEEVIYNFGMLTRILDGRGYVSDTGVHGQRGYQGDYYFTWLGAVIEIPHRVWKLLGHLGPKIYFYRLPEENITAEQKLAQIKKTLKENSYVNRLNSSKDAIRNFWDVLIQRPDMVDGKIVWDSARDDEETVNKIIKLAMVLASLRATIPTWQTGDSDSSGSNYHFEMPIKEEPSRASSVLYNIARGHAVLYGRNHVTKDDLSVVVPIVRSSAPRERVDLFRLLIENDGLLNTEQLMNIATMSRATALKEMQKLAIMGLVDKAEQATTTKPIVAIRLKNEFRWFLSPDFKQYWDEFHSSHTPKICELSPNEGENSEKRGVCEPLGSNFTEEGEEHACN